MWIGERVGFWPTVGLVVATALAGTWMARWAGLAVLRRFRVRLAAGQLPGRELTDGLIILAAGAFLLTPGVLTDAVGLLGLLPPTRAWIRRRLEGQLRRAIADGRAIAFTPGPPPAATQPPPASASDVDVTDADVTDADVTDADVTDADVTDATVIKEVEVPGATARRPSPAGRPSARRP